MEQDPHITAWVEVPASWGDPPRRFIFAEPVDRWHAARLEHVRTAVERVERAQQAGLYVVGYLAYEAAPAFDAAMITPPPGALPYAWFAAYRAPLDLGAWPSGDPCRAGSVRGPFLRIAEPDYIAAVNRCLAHIRAGDIYQVNYTVRADVEAPDGFALFRTLLAAVPMPHAAYLSVHGPEPDGPPVQIVSLSPELFLRRRGRVLESRPMKGTARREPSWVADEAARRALSRDEKNRAENIMIVDLVRNDLGRVCRMGTVTVPELCRVDRFPTVHQMTSLVRGEHRDGVPLFEIFTALFPPGSVTGAPKIRAMQIIAGLEPEPRGIYCGALGLFFPNGDFELSVPIRTLQQAGVPNGRQADSAISESQSVRMPASRHVLGLGSGIVADSDPQAEWYETQLKGRFVSAEPRDFILYETIRYDRKESPAAPGPEPAPPSASSFLDLHSHLRRLRQSCLYFGQSFPLAEIIRHLRDLQRTLGFEPARIRLDLKIPSGLKFQASHFEFPSASSLQIESHVIRENLRWPEGGMQIMLSERRLDPADFRLYHKTTLRPEKYEELEKARAHGATEVLFLNTRGELCEGALSNIVLRIGGEWLTPALSCGLLPGTWREKQLSAGRLREAVLTLDDLRRADEICMGNAVRGKGLVTGIIRSSGAPL